MVRAKLLSRTKNRTPSHVCAWQQCIMAYVNAGHVTIFSTGGKFYPVLKLHALTPPARSYVLLLALLPCY